MLSLRTTVVLALTWIVTVTPTWGAESLWLEAEHFTGIQGYCWPMGNDKRKMRETNGNWGLSGPGWAAEWAQGGESGFLSIATAANDDKATVSRTIDVPVDGDYAVWVRYGDWREKTERFQVRIEQPGAKAWTGRYGERPMIEEDNVMKLYWGWSFVWAKQVVTLKKGAAKIELKSTTKDPEPRQIDVVVLTTDHQYRPRIKDRPTRHAWDILNDYRKGVPTELEPLARRTANYQFPDLWQTRTFRDGDFLYLWNVSHTKPLETWLSDKPDRVKFPYNIIDKETQAEFDAKYGGKDDVPIYSDPRVVPTFHGAGAGVFATDPTSGEVQEIGQRFAAWLDADPKRSWAMMMNYHPGKPIGDKGVAMFQKYRDRFVGSIAGESLGYFYPPAAEMKAATDKATTRRALVDAFAPLTLKYNAEKYRKVYGRDLDANPYIDVISCLSVGNIVFAPLCADWGARIVGYESSTATSSVLNMRWAFMRGAARQNGTLTATYRSCNFGDSSTIFSNGGSYHTPQNLLDNYYSVFSGAGMTWYKFDIWYQYMAGSSMFYHEQGFDEYWRPGGTTAAGIKEVQLSPKGKLVDRFLRVTGKQPDRGSPFTPVAFLVDHAHGWEPAPFWPNSFKNWHQHQDRFLFGDHERMLEEWFWTAYYPIGPESEKPMTGTNEVYLPGVFGDIFDVIFAYPDVSKWKTIDTYPVVIANGDIELTAAEGQRLAKYVEDGGTLLVADAHLTGPGVAFLKLPQTKPLREGSQYQWHLRTEPSGESPDDQNSAAFRFRPIDGDKGRALATTTNGDVFCSAIDRGKGRLVYLSIPRGLTITKEAHPVVARLIAHLSRDLMPLEVDGDVQWMVNKTQTGWTVTLLNPAGQAKPQQGISPTDFRENRTIKIRSRIPISTASDLLLPDDPLTVKDNQVTCEVSAGGVRLIQLK
jgi:hypothetical protein